VGIYDRLSRYDTDEGIVIVYGTMYGNTERMAERIARSASEAGIKNIIVYNVSKTHHSYIIADVFRYRGLIVGAPTYNTGLYAEMDYFINEIASRDIKNHYLGYFGSYAWAGQAVKKIREYNDTRLKFEVVGTPVEMKQSLKPDDVEACCALGRAMAERLIADRK
jgi:flavorubredoxin